MKIRQGKAGREGGRVGEVIKREKCMEGGYRDGYEDGMLRVRVR